MYTDDFSLYIHIPFCSSFCDYCDFYSVSAKDYSGCYDKFLQALADDIKYQINYFEVKNIITAYIGGGTPSVLGKKIGFLLDELKKLPQFTPLEFTIEANPESLTEEFLSVCKEGGINRLSLGVQTFFEPSRAAVNRGLNFKGIEEKLKIASDYFLGSFSADLIIGLPFQNEKTVTEDIKKLLDFNPVHVSLYSLTIEEETPLYENIKTKNVNLPCSETADSLWLLARNILSASGLNHYEVSNFAKTGSECLHNIRYWRMQNWLGAGPAASGTIINEKKSTAGRFTYKNDLSAYIKSPCVKNAVYEDLDKNMLMRESLLMGFRRKEGPDAEIFKRRFGLTAEECIPKTLSKWKDKEKMLFLNQFLLDAFSELI